MKILLLLVAGLSSVVVSCGHGGGSNGNGPTFDPYAGNFDANVMPVVVGDCGANGYANEPCTRIQICEPGTSNCQTIDNVLVDTGSYGLRIFSKQVSVNLPQVASADGGALAECAQFGTSNTWGPIKTAQVVLSGEQAVTVPIQVIDSTFGSVPSDCTSPDASAEDAGYNGILGVGLLSYDCGQDCVSSGTPELYYSCQSASCSSAAVSLDKQVVNPVSKLPVDNNGVILELPSVPDEGKATLIGTLTLGIGTAANNSAGQVKVYAADSSGDFKTKFKNNNYQSSFIDSGSNGLFFPMIPELPLCSQSASQAGFYCPSSQLNFTATQVGADGSTQIDVTFNVTNATMLLTNYGPVVGAFNNIAGTQTAAFDWGLPFFFGRKVYVGLEEKTSTLGTGPYWAW